MLSIFNKIHHVAIICSDYQKSKEFYAGLLGLPVIREVYRRERDSYKLDLKINDYCNLELFSFPSPPKRLSYPEAVGLRHIAFEVENIDTVCSFLLAHGVEVEPIRIDAFTNKKCTFFRDPDDLPIEIYQG
ncbi:VOC family protein [Ethanoligenens harbinense]|uniref:Glyoxalase/bleomycin resistance protein/dioxygenase n=1 Tax=Ethanoligenens harbinense (strain DSM 18485 / JCM 12961 / CGMCC 1.5033 / YUAN-3) TaxID=663278 RepID=E6U8D6_ETHHY|nr:VOC family protein [Ethanoligenens harbinense]ADU28255.1 Glyoxalase/bleomycin resistance protein/dioxygenase [Ethanoligenens harbinense YUAN-3]AVQ97251.1 VOC family protein [Ethanoligenens harbinense YUAN-3]AYF39916.1 VOC family protein [Ethanoligenens harbinense]AYF42746.1 VOC family protein [Ethanoligenens harbinense]QCN93496.1 VOC family protein [Ethanoligenens harbinense]